MSGLERLGKVAGIGGISVGAAVLLLNAVIGMVPGLPADQQAGIVKLVAYLSFSIGLMGILAWYASHRLTGDTAYTRGSQSPATVAKGNVEITYAEGALARSGASTSKDADSHSNAAAQTWGEQSPAVISNADVVVRFGPAGPTGSSPIGKE